MDHHRHLQRAGGISRNDQRPEGPHDTLSLGPSKAMAFQGEYCSSKLADSIGIRSLKLLRKRSATINPNQRFGRSKIVSNLGQGQNVLIRTRKPQKGYFSEVFEVDQFTKRPAVTRKETPSPPHMPLLHMYGAG